MKSPLQSAGWVRGRWPRICQDIPTLLRVNRWEYDLANAEFLAYFTARTGLVWDGFPDFAKAGFESAAAMAAWAWNPATTGLPEHLVIARAKMQDCWELFAAGDRTTAPAPVAEKCYLTATLFCAI